MQYFNAIVLTIVGLSTIVCATPVFDDALGNGKTGNVLVDPQDQFCKENKIAIKALCTVVSCPFRSAKLVARD